MKRNIKGRHQRVACISESRVSSYYSEVVTMLASTEQIRCRGLREQLNDIRVATKSCDIKLNIGITWINVNQNSSTSLGQSAINN